MKHSSIHTMLMMIILAAAALGCHGLAAAAAST
jgi:uncharacterized membrane protein YtjA (UPF0391 family)